MRTYELALVMKASVKEAERKKLLATIKEWLKDIKIIKEHDWGQKALSYQIQKEDAGHYYMLELASETGVQGDFEQRLIRNESVIRHLLLRTK